MTTEGSAMYSSALLPSSNNTNQTTNTAATSATVPTDMTTTQPLTSVPKTNEAVAAAVAANVVANAAANVTNPNTVTLSTDPKSIPTSLPTNVAAATAVTAQPPPPPSTHMPPPMAAAAAAAAFGQYPHGVVFAPAEAAVMEDTPTYVNPKQYARILKRRESRKKQTGTDVTSYTPRKRSYMHESRHKHAMQRRRGPGGRFLSKEEREDMARQQKTATAGQ